MGRKRKADAIDSSNDANKDSEVTNGAVMSNNENMVSAMQSNTTNNTAGQQPVTAAKTPAAMVVATPGSNLISDPKTKVITC